MAAPAGLVESQKLPEPLFTPSTKAEQGQHDENISPAQGACLRGHLALCSELIHSFTHSGIVAFLVPLPQRLR